MNYLREKDDRCYELCKLQSRIFERSAKEGIPSTFFIKVYLNSKYSYLMDRLEIFNYEYGEELIYRQVSSDVHMKRGTVIAPEIMSWIGYLLREWSYIYSLTCKQIVKAIPISYIASVYPLYHSLSIEEAIIRIAESRSETKLITDPQKRMYDLAIKYYSKKPIRQRNLS